MVDTSTEERALQLIKHDPLMKKFQLYGFLKNLQFFEPFLLLIFINWGFNLIDIGMFILIREVFMYTFEIPSGIMADSYGKKTVLLLCFLFYMISFVFYYLGPGVVWLILGSAFYGLGEAFRTGTHKAMELRWMENEGILEYKALVYGKTRSWSLIGSAINSILAIVLIFLIPADHWIFLAAIVPFLLDFILIYSYPAYMNEKAVTEKIGWKRQIQADVKSLGIILKEKDLRKGVLTSAIYDGIFSTIKDYIQPIMKGLIALLIIRLMLDDTYQEDGVKIVLGFVYSIFYIVSSFASKNSYYVAKKCKSTKRTIDLLFDLFAIILILEAIFIWIEVPILIIFVYLIIYMIYNLRRPLLVGYIGELAPKDRRATILSVESQVKAISVFIFAPLFGLIAEKLSIPWLFIMIAFFIFVLNLWLRGEKATIKEEVPSHGKPA